MNKKRLVVKEIKKKPGKLYSRGKKNILTFLMGHKLLSKPKIKTLDEIMNIMIKKPTTRLTELSQCKVDITSPMKSTLNRIDTFFTSGMSLDELKDIPYEKRPGEIISAAQRMFFKEEFSKKKEEIITYQGKHLAVEDWSAIAKHSRAIFEGRGGMECVGRVHDGRSPKPVVGYGILFTGFPTVNGFKFYDFSLYSNTYMDEHPDDFCSIPDLERQTIERLKIFLSPTNILLIGDRHFSSKGQLDWLKNEEGIDFLMRIDSDINITYKEEWCNVVEEAKSIKEKHKVFWKEKENKKTECECSYFHCNLFNESSKKYLEVTIIYLIPKNAKAGTDPMILVTTLKVTDKNLQEIVDLYKYRWQIETGIEYLKQNFGLEKIMVQYWEAIKSMIAFVLWIDLIFFICLTGMIEEKYLLELVKKFTIVKGNKLTYGRLIWFYLNLFAEETMPLRNIKKFLYNR